MKEITKEQSSKDSKCAVVITRHHVIGNVLYGLSKCDVQNITMVQIADRLKGLKPEDILKYTVNYQNIDSSGQQVVFDVTRNVSAQNQAEVITILVGDQALRKGVMVKENLRQFISLHIKIDKLPNEVMTRLTVVSKEDIIG